MKVSSVCFALAIFLSNSVSVLAQESDTNQKLAEMQTTIENLKAKTRLVEEGKELDLT